MALEGEAAERHADGSHRALQGVLSANLRRRHPHGSAVEVYRGVHEGWVPGTVDEEAIDIDAAETAKSLKVEKSFTAREGFPRHSKFVQWEMPGGHAGIHRLMMMILVYASNS